MANTGFAFDLLKQVAGEQPGTNIFLSPYSVSTVLQMVANGATGGTWAEMRRVLKTTGQRPEALNTAYLDLNRFLNSQSSGISNQIIDIWRTRENYYHLSNGVLNLANGIWYQKDVHLKPAFVSVNRQFFQAELAPVDFRKPESVKAINDWAADRTQGKIRGIVQWPVNPLTGVILANAIYFKGNWESPFEESETRRQPFHLADGQAQSVLMMRQEGEFGYQENADFQAVSLDYLNPGQQMLIFLPRKNSDLKKLIAGLDGGTWQNTICPQFKRQRGMLMFPRFNMECHLMLNSSLQALGMKRAFSDGAEFSAMSDEPLFISEVKQKSFIEVNEKGTEAAAVSFGGMSKGGDRATPFAMVVDRPFLFVIYNVYTKTILFMGVIFDPAGQGS